MTFGHKQSWRPPATNRGSCDLNVIVVFGHNQLWRPTASKFRVWFKNMITNDVNNTLYSRQNPLLNPRKVQIYRA